MRTGRLLRSLLRLLRSYRSVRRTRRIRRSMSLPFLQMLEPRLVQNASSLTPPVVMLSATTTNSMSVTIDYKINQAAGSSLPLQFGVYRSSDSWFDSGDNLVCTWTASAQGTVPFDASGLPATTPGTHQLTIPLPGGLPPDPQKPYVLVVADPSISSAATNPQQTASFRKYVIGVVTHGALINPSWKHGPPWQLQTATLLERQGYDAVIPYNWASQSSKPGRAAIQGPRLARQILVTASRFPTTAPVDLHLIGHSEGAVVNTQAIVALEKSITPQLKAGFLEDTLLDPHAANNNVPGQASAASGLFGALARGLVTRYQARANDPPVFIPSGVDAAQVFYQHSSASRHQGIYNLWGQVPVPNLSGNPIAYYNLTAAGVIHSGNYGVSLWYRNFVAPTLGDQAPLIQALQLKGQVDQVVTIPVASAGALAQRRLAAWGPVDVVQGPQTAFSGTAAPGSKVRVYLGPAANPSKIALAGQTTADTTGAWTLTTRPLHDGHYRAVAMAFSRALQTRPGLAIVPMVPLGRFTVEAPFRS
jgi:hypothetical protein